MFRQTNRSLPPLLINIVVTLQATLVGAQSTQIEAPNSNIVTPPAWQFKPTLDGKSVCANSVCFSPDGSLLAVWGRTPNIWLVDAQTGKLNRELSIPGPIADLCFGHDRNTIYAVGEDEQLGVVRWDLATGEQTIISGHSAVLLDVAQNTLVVIDRNAWQELSLPDLITVSRNQFGQQLIPLCVDSELGGMLAVDVMAGQLGQRPNLVWFDSKTKLPIPISTTANSLAAACVIPESGGLVAFSESEFGGFKLASVELSTPADRFTSKSRLPIVRMGRSIVHQLAATVDGRFLIAAEQSSHLRIWELVSRAEVCDFQAGIGQISSLAVSNRPEMIAVAVNENEECRIILFRMLDAIRARLRKDDSQRTNDQWMERLDHPTASEAYSAVVQLANNPEDSLPKLTRYISRVAVIPEENYVAHWIAELDATEFTRRRSAYNSLLNVRDLIIPQLEATLASGQTLGTQLSLQRLLNAAPADSDMNPRVILRGMRLLSVLEMIDNSQSCALLEVMRAGHPSAGSPCRIAPRNRVFEVGFCIVTPFCFSFVFFRKSMKILILESTCDETAAAIVTEKLQVLGSVVASQDELHGQFHGVVPELAARAHVERIVPVIDQTLKKASTTLAEIDAIAVAYTPGLAGSLLVGVTAAKALAPALDKPLVGVNHLQSHIYACRLAAGRDVFPCVGLVVSGGHTSLYRCSTPTDFTLLGGTIDDAAGEAFDKVAAMLKLPFPGGPAVSRLAESGDKTAISFPRPLIQDPRLAFSFSGLKTAVRYEIAGSHNLDPTEVELDDNRRADIAASFQEAVIDCLVSKSIQAIRSQSVNRLCVGGGVAANRRLRQRLEQTAIEHQFELIIAPPDLCTDNAVMSAIAIEHLRRRGCFAGSGNRSRIGALAALLFGDL